MTRQLVQNIVFVFMGKNAKRSCTPVIIACVNNGQRQKLYSNKVHRIEALIGV